MWGFLAVLVFCPFSSFVRFKQWWRWQKQCWQSSDLASWALNHSCKYGFFTSRHAQRPARWGQVLDHIVALRSPLRKHIFVTSLWSMGLIWERIDKESKEKELTKRAKRKNWPMLVTSLQIVKWKSLSRVRGRTLCDPVDYTVHGILQARILEWVAYPFSNESSRPRNQTRVSCLAGGFFLNWAIRKAATYHILYHYDDEFLYCSSHFTGGLLFLAAKSNF